MHQSAGLSVERFKWVASDGFLLTFDCSWVTRFSSSEDGRELGRPEADSANVDTNPMVAESCFSSIASHSDCGDEGSTGALSARGTHSQPNDTYGPSLAPRGGHLSVLLDHVWKKQAANVRRKAFPRLLAYLSPAGFVPLQTGFESTLLSFEGGGARLFPFVSTSVLKHLAVNSLLALRLDDAHPVLDAIIFGFGSCVGGHG